MLSLIGIWTAMANTQSFRKENVADIRRTNGRRARHKCSVLGCPWRIDFSRVAFLLIASSGKATSMSFFL
jgi:hypothetical protein